MIVEGFHVHVPKGHIYFAIAFSMAVEMFNIRVRRMRNKPAQLHKPLREDDQTIRMENTPP